MLYAAFGRVPPARSIAARWGVALGPSGFALICPPKWPSTCWPSRIAEYTKAVEKEDALDYDEPADWFYPTRAKPIGATLLTRAP